MKQAERVYFFGQEGQKILVQEWGPLDCPVILMFHGFPGCADHGKLMSSSPLWQSFRLIAMDRPGYGQSDLQKKLTPLGFAQQIKSLLDEKGIDQFSILSVSGGAPYSMALAYLLKDRVRKVTSVAGIAPLTRKNFSYMNSQQKKAWALRNFVPSPVLHYALKRVWASSLEKFDQLLFTEMESFNEHDRKVFAHPEVGPDLIETTKHALRQGPGGILRDMTVYSRDWGFPLHHIECPVTLWHGGDDDVVHYHFAEEMKRQLPKAQLNLMSDEGHYSLPMNCRDDILSDLLTY